MLGDAGNIASLVGVAISLFGLGFAILQILKLRGETRAAREAAEATRTALGRDMVIADVTRLNERLQLLKEIHRDGNRPRALDHYPEIIGLFQDIRRRHPGLSDNDREMVMRAIVQITEIEQTVERLESVIPLELGVELNRILRELQSGLLGELEERLQHLAGG